MIQTYDQISRQTSTINKILADTVFIQKIYSTSFFLCLSMRTVGKTHYLYIGRGRGYEGVWLSNEKPEPFLRKRDTFLEYIRKFLSATQFITLEIDEEDRIIKLKYQKWRVVNTFAIFYKGRSLYFSHHFFNSKTKTMQTLKSWTTVAVDAEVFNSTIFNEVGRKKLEVKNIITEDKIFDFNLLLEEERKQAIKSAKKKKKQKFLLRKLKHIEGDLERVALWGDLQEYANSIADFSVLEKKSRFRNLKINFKEKEHYKRRNEIFTKAKKLKKAEGILKERLSNTKIEVNKNFEKEEDRINTLIPIKPFWNQREQNSVVEPIKKSGGYKVYRFESMSFAIGLSANGNDEMRKSWGKKTDVWFHLDDIKSPHIILKLGEGTLDEETLNIVGSALMEYSDFNFSEVNMIYTQVKNLKGVRGAAGKVTFKKEKHIKVLYRNDWKSLTLSD